MLRSLIPFALLEIVRTCDLFRCSSSRSLDGCHIGRRVDGGGRVSCSLGSLLLAKL